MRPEIESRSVASLIPYALNARTHDDAQVAMIAGSIREFGFCNPVLISSDGDIIAGHGRVLAAQKLGLDEVPCVVLDHLDERKRKAYVLADNQIALKGGWDDAMLTQALQESMEAGFDNSLLGFTQEDVDALGRAFEEDIPGGNKEINEDDLAETENECPKCGFKW